MRALAATPSRTASTITSDNPDLGEVREELEAEYEYDGEPIAIGDNPKYVTAAARRGAVVYTPREQTFADTLAWWRGRSAVASG
ncbi:MAG: hypothetical protein M3680_10930 [Myxococcota bacterium]|nr:hypothetical protein [Myxococcota bacterium]